MTDKVVDLATAIGRHVHDGDRVFLGGFGHAVPFAATHELIRQERRQLELCRSGADIAIDQLIAAGCVAKLTFGYVGNPGIGLSHSLSRAIKAGSLELEEWTNFSMVLRLRASALGVPFLPTYILGEGDIAETCALVRTVTCPFTGDELRAVPALKPDVALVHAQRADSSGNVQMRGIRGDTVDGAMASDRIVVTVEEIVDYTRIAADPDLTVLPAHRVSSVSVVPFGAHPSWVDGFYGRDDDAYREYDTLSRSVDLLDDFIATWITQMPDRAAYHAAWTGSR